MITTQLVGLEEIQDAARVLAPAIVRTPLLRADAIADKIGAPVWVKPEVLQRGGAFKFRGAFNFLSQLNPEARERGVVAPSSGNHAQAVALAAKIYGVPATVVMPTTVTPAKRSGAERLGARIVLAGTTTTDRLERAQELVAEEGLTLTLPNARVIGVEPTSAPKLTRAREAGRPVRLEHTGGLADGLMSIQIGTLTFAHHERFLDDVVTVDDSALRGAMRLLLDRLKLVVEPSGAITAAALLEGKSQPRGNGATVAVLSGGNIEWEGLRELLG